MITIPPIKIQGIKTKLVPHIQNMVSRHTINKWTEPFMGSGVVGFNIVSNHHIMNDINTHIINFYNAIKKREITPQIVREFLETNGNNLRNSSDSGQTYFREVRERFNFSNHPLDFLFLSRSCFNGLIRFNGRGKYNVPFCKNPDRFSKAYITKIVNQIDSVSKLIDDSWEFTNNSFEDTILRATEGDMLYCDPPYMGLNTDYFSKWTIDDELKLFDLLLNTKAKFILSSWKSTDTRINEHFIKYSNNFKYMEIEHRYQVGPKQDNRNPVIEVLIYNF